MTGDDGDATRLVREVQALPLISANMTGGSGLNRMYTFHSNVMYVYVQVSHVRQAVR